MKRLLLDVNVLLDVILDRTEAPTAAALWAALERGSGEGYIPAHGVTTIYYVLAKAGDRSFARTGIEAILSVFAVASVDQPVLRRALGLQWNDYEDAVCASAAEAAGCHAVVTRDPQGFPEAPVRVLDPGTALAWLTE